MRTLRVSIIGVVLVAVSALGVAAQAEEQLAGSDLLIVEGTASFTSMPGHSTGTDTMSDARVSGDVVVDYDYVNRMQGSHAAGPPSLLARRLAHASLVRSAVGACRVRGDR